MSDLQMTNLTSETTDDVQSLLARIKALEKENTELRQQKRQSVLLIPKLSPTKLKSTSYDDENHISGDDSNSDVYFDGIRTRFERQSEFRLNEEPTEKKRISSLTYPDGGAGTPDDVADEVLDAFIDEHYGSDQQDISENSIRSEETDNECQISCLKVPRGKKNSESHGFRRVSFGVDNEEEENDDIQSDTNGTLSENETDYTDSVFNTFGSSERPERCTFSGPFKTVVDEDIKIGKDNSLRRPGQAAGRRWSLISSSTDGSILYDFSGNQTKRLLTKDKIHFSLGNKKTNRYRQMEKFLKESSTQSNLATVADESPYASSTEKSNATVQKKMSLNMNRSDSDKYVTGDVTNEGSSKKAHIQMPTTKTVSRGIELFIKLNSMSRMISQKEHSTINVGDSKKKQLAFSQFFELSIDLTDVQSKDDCQWRDGGCGFLDPIILKQADCIDYHPRNLKSGKLSANELSSFCCLQGVRTRLMPRAALNGAARLGLIGTKADQYKLLAFTDGDGSISHGVALTIFEKVPSDTPGFNNLLEFLKRHRLRRSAASQISRWWRWCLKENRHQSGNRDVECLTIDEDISIQKRIRKRDIVASVAQNFVPRIKNSKSKSQQNMVQPRRNRDSRLLSRSLRDSATEGMIALKKKVKSPPNNDDLSYNIDLLSEVSTKEDVEYPSLTGIPLQSIEQNPKRDRRSKMMMGKMHGQRSLPVNDVVGGIKGAQSCLTSGKTTRQFSERIKFLGRESFGRMVEDDSICIIEKCYVMLGGLQSEQFLQFCSLQHLVDMEREKNIGGRTLSDGGDYESINFKTSHHEEMLRHKFLRVIQLHMILSTSQSHVRLPKSDVEILMRPPPTFNIELPSLNTENKLSIPLPLPHIAGHWGVASLLNRLKSDDLMALLKILLIERSVLVLGESSIIVSACTCALLELIKPFTWASNFMPLLPEEMLDFISSPVPFVIGVVGRNEEHCAMIEKDDRVIEARAEGLNIVNLCSGSVRLTTENGIQAMVKKCPCPKTQLLRYKARLKALSENSLSLKSFPTFLDQGFNRKEVVTLKAVRHAVEEYVKSFALDIASSSVGWQKYGKYDKDEESYDFYPSLFVEPLRQQLESQLLFQEMMSHSQLFIEYVDQRRKDYIRKKNVARGEIGQFIATWIYCRWKQKKKTRHFV